LQRRRRLRCPRGRCPRPPRLPPRAAQSRLAQPCPRPRRYSRPMRSRPTRAALTGATPCTAALPRNSRPPRTFQRRRGGAPAQAGAVLGPHVRVCLALPRELGADHRPIVSATRSRQSCTRRPRLTPMASSKTRPKRAGAALLAPCRDAADPCCSLSEVFQCAGNKKRDFSRRGSSGNWAEDQLTWKARSGKVLLGTARELTRKCCATGGTQFQAPHGLFRRRRRCHGNAQIHRSCRRGALVRGSTAQLC